MTTTGKLAFAGPRYGADVVGGSEAVMREAAHGLAQRGWNVELLTSCARDHYTWANEHPAGATRIDGVTVHRFPVEHAADRRHDDIAARIFFGKPVSLAEQRVWLDAPFRVPALFHHLVVEVDRYDVIVLSPYLWWTTITGAAVAPERTVVMPCLHDEPYARLEVLEHVLAEPAMLWFLSEPEHELAHRLASLPARHPVTGAGVPVPEAYDIAGFRARHGIDRPYLLFAGRRERGKGWDRLIDAYAFAVARYDLPLDLVTAGVGPARVPGELADRVLDLGFLADAEVPNAFAAAAAYVQPSPNESFSRTVMEAWLARTPVLATAESEVLRWHCLLFADEYEFAQCLAFVAGAPKVASALADRGREYVLANYRWEVVLDAMEDALRELL
jgi:glycosyltransferase involved in cell wall biosynthesis